MSRSDRIKATGAMLLKVEGPVLAHLEVLPRGHWPYLKRSVPLTSQVIKATRAMLLEARGPVLAHLKAAGRTSSEAYLLPIAPLSRSDRSYAP